MVSETGFSDFAHPEVFLVTLELEIKKLNNNAAASLLFVLDFHSGKDENC